MSGAILALLVAATPVADRLKDANDAARGGDYPRAIAGYRELARSGAESGSIYWNWAQAAAARGANGEALYALLRARELEPGDRAVAREIERMREAANLDAAEIAPEPLAGLGRWCRRLELARLAVVLAAVSLALHAFGRVRDAASFTAAGLWTLGAALVVAALPLAASRARPTAVVLLRGAPLFDAASPMASAVGSLREGEVVPVLEPGEGFLRVEDSSGARGWARAGDVARLDRPPAAGS